MNKILMASLFLLTIACQQTKKEKSKVVYMPFNYSEANFTGIQGIRAVESSDNVYIAGTYTLPNDSIKHGLVYKGPLSHSGKLGTWYTLDYTSDQFNDITLTSCYGPNNGNKEHIQVVGAYQRDATGKQNHGFLYQGPITGMGKKGKWTTIRPGGIKMDDVNNVFVHSTMGGLAVGNYDLKNVPSSGFSFIYDIKNRTNFTYMVPNSFTTTLYGIWQNSETNYTLAGGFSKTKLGKISQAFLVDYDSSTKRFSHFKAFNYNNNPKSAIITHFEGITNSDTNGYNIAADWVSIDGTTVGASLVRVNRSNDGSFEDAVWKDISYPKSSITSANTVYKNNILGIYATIDTTTNQESTSSFTSKIKL